ncbi:MAG TPA: inositol monophosphatase family protein [Bacillota bacterium]|nr:inositol monophosphatase family protein [Bacillota bacterium]
MEYAIYLETAVSLARRAGNLIRESFGGEFEKGFKSCPSDLVTEVDRRSEELITDGIGKSFPGHTIIGEESEKQARAGSGGFTWFVDPLDGTTNFVYGIPFFAVSIGLARDFEMVAGVVFDPLRNECFCAIKNGGAFLNGKPVRVDLTRGSFADSLIVTGYPSNKAFNKRLLKVDYHKIIEGCANLRALGSAALELAYVACGRLTGFWENTLRPWDVAAGSLLVEEAGGTVTDTEGNKLTLEGYPSIAATNGLIHKELLKTLSA